MATTSVVIGAPVWDRAWSLPLWFDSIRANCDPERTGLVFVIPAADVSTREAIAALSEGFCWVEILRDRGEQSKREERPATGHLTLAAARNQILHVVSQVKPEYFISWDSDILMPAGTVDAITEMSLPLVTSWTWLNRREPRLIRHFDGREYNEVLWEDPIRATAMRWDSKREGRAFHYPAEEFMARARGTWKTDVALAFQVMDRRAYSVANYAPHHDGEDVTFSWQLQRRGIQRWCCGDIQGVHLYDRTALAEIQMGWPDILTLQHQLPLAARWQGPRSKEYEAFGFFSEREAFRQGLIGSDSVAA